MDIFWNRPFTIDYSKSILTLNSSASVKNNILEQYSLTFLNGLQATKIFQNISNNRVLAPVANHEKVILKTVHVLMYQTNNLFRPSP